MVVHLRAEGKAFIVLLLILMMWCTLTNLIQDMSNPYRTSRLFTEKEIVLGEVLRYENRDDNKSCEACKDSISHHDRAHEVIPESMHMLAAGEQISVDFATFNNSQSNLIFNSS